jgi:hypothetical protein
MRTAPRRRIITRMTRTLRLSLELELTDPIRGMIIGPDHEPRDFSGWLEMHAAIEAACTRALSQSRSEPGMAGQGAPDRRPADTG